MARDTEEASGWWDKGWIGVDLDGTLAEYHGYGQALIGRPVGPIAKEVRMLVEGGLRVKIFTARADNPEDVAAIQRWLGQHGLPALEVTNVKDRHCWEIWDDRARQVERNTGRFVTGTPWGPFQHDNGSFVDARALPPPYPTVWATVGVPGSGKSTWARRHCEKTGAVLVNKDAIRTMLHGGRYEYTAELERLVGGVARNTVASALGMGCSVVVDECHITREKRQSLLNTIESFSRAGVQPIRCVLVVFRCDEECLRRRLQEPRGLSAERWTEVWRKMMDDFEEPAANEGFEIVHV